MKLSKDSVMKCSFPEWYKAFEDVTVKSVILPLPKHFLEYLHTDGLVLPESSSHGIYTKSENTCMDGDEDDPDIRDEDLMNMYEDDWSTPDKIPDSVKPDLGTFEEEVKCAIKSLGGRVFPKLNWSSPKDADWISFDKTLLCTCPSDVFLLLKSSEFVSHDLDEPFGHCDAGDDSSTPEISYCLVLRKWSPPEPSTEFRCFVHNKKLIAMCQRNGRKYYKHLSDEKSAVFQDVKKFFTNKISKCFPDESYVFDVTRPKEGKVILVDFNPFGTVTDPVLFSWEEIDEISVKVKDEDEPVTDIRVVESEEGIRSGEYANSAFPQDIQDLAHGTDPSKLIDLMKLKCSEGSSDDEEQQP